MISGIKYVSIYLFVTIGVLLLFAGLQKQNYDNVLENSASQAKNLSWILETNLDASLRRMDGNLIKIARTVQPKHFSEGELPSPQMSWSDYLRGFKYRFPEVSDYFLFDAAGQMVAASAPEAKPFSIADRKHFRALRDDPALETVLSDVVLTRTDGKSTAILAHALRSPDGHFLGIVSVLLDFAYWQRTFAALNIGPKGLIAVRRTQTHGLILRRPQVPEAINQPVDTPLTRRIAAGETDGVMMSVSSVDKVMRISAFHVLPDYPVYVVVALAEEDVLAAWRRQASYSAVAVVCILFLLGLALFRLCRAEVRRDHALHELRVSEAKVRELAYYDPLTHLANRRLLLDHLAQSLIQAQRFERALALMFLDLDKFKVLNDTLGHDAGDAVLVEVAQRLQNCVRSGDTVCRQGGDEFVILLAEITHAADAVTVADKILASLDEPIHFNGQIMRIATSIGIAIREPGSEAGVELLMKLADDAMYEAKKGGGHRFVLAAK